VSGGGNPNVLFDATAHWNVWLGGGGADWVNTTVDNGNVVFQASPNADWGWSGDTAKTLAYTNGGGTPEGDVAACVGSLYSQTDGTASATLWVKESGTGNTGWRKVTTTAP